MKKQKQKLYAYKSSGKMYEIYWNDLAQAERQPGLETQQLIKTMKRECYQSGGKIKQTQEVGGWSSKHD